MKKIIFLAMTILLSVSAFSQNARFVVTSEGLRDANDETKDFIVIDEGNVTAKDLYDRALRYVQETYKNPDVVLKGNTPGEYLRIHTIASEFMRYNNSGAKIPIDAEYYIELRFKDGKVRYEIGNLTMKGSGKNSSNEVKFSGGVMSGYVIYKKNGDLFKKEAKEDIENYFNTQVSQLQVYLNNSSKTEDDW